MILINRHNFLRILCISVYVFGFAVLQSYCQPAPKISTVEFSGNDYFSSRELLNFIASRENTIFSEIQFKLDLKNIIINYQNAGYIACRIPNYRESYNFDSSEVEIYVEISEGKQVLIGEVIIEGNRLFKTSYLQNAIDTKPGKVLNSIALSKDAEDILDMYETKGYTFASVNVENIEQYSDNGTEKLRVKIRIDENEKIKIDNIVIEGNTSTRRDVIVREITLDEGNTITKENLLDIRKRLENLGYFESVDEPKILKYKRSTVLQIRVKEGNTNTFDGILGYVPPTQNEESGYFTGLVNLSIRNLFGTGRKVEARFQKEIKTTQELELRYLEPWLLGYPLNINLGFLQRIEDSLYIKRELGMKAEAMITKKFSVSLLFNYERVIPTVTTTLQSIFDSRLLASGVELKFDSRDYVYNPYSGILYRTSYSVGQKKIYNTASFPGLDIPGDFTVQKGAVDLDFYYTFFKRQSSLISLHGVEIRSPRFETADLYRFGGIQSVRGYRDGQFLASRCAWSNIEVRYSLARRTFVFGFYDFGYYLKPEDDISKIAKQEGFIFGYGLGIRLETALGMFGVSYALGRGDSILEGKIHFGLVNNF